MPNIYKSKAKCENINVEKEPIKILLHCGTNDVDKGNVEEIIKDIDECLNTLLGKLKNFINYYFFSVTEERSWVENDSREYK